MKTDIKMKKALSILVLVSVIAPMAALAQPKTSCTLRHTIDGFDSLADVGVGNQVCIVNQNVSQSNAPGYWGICCILDAVHTVTDWIFYALVVIVALLVIWGGFSIATAGGAPEKVSAGRSYILYAMIGLAVALLSKAIPALVGALIK